MKHILFDVDGTLLDSREAFCGSLERALHRYSISHGDISIYFTCTLAQFVADFDIKDPSFLPEWNADYVASLVRAPLFDGVEDMLRRLHEAGVPMGVVTSRLHNIALTGLAEKGLGDCFVEVVASDDVSRPKPDAEPIQLYMSRRGANQADVLYIGDAVTDRQCAEAAGVRFAAPAWAPLPPELQPCTISQANILSYIEL
ncbi:MAG: HAD family hydrolase [Bacteroidales bacterium]|nr:HAD family hydrolase [Bacteroidales bacterium]